MKNTKLRQKGFYFEFEFPSAKEATEFVTWWNTATKAGQSEIAQEKELVSLTVATYHLIMVPGSGPTRSYFKDVRLGAYITHFEMMGESVDLKKYYKKTTSTLLKKIDKIVGKKDIVSEIKKMVGLKGTLSFLTLTELINEDFTSELKHNLSSSLGFNVQELPFIINTSVARIVFAEKDWPKMLLNRNLIGNLSGLRKSVSTSVLTNHSGIQKLISGINEKNINAFLNDYVNAETRTKVSTLGRNASRLSTKSKNPFKK